MTTALSSVGRELYDQLTTRTFYVVDTEFSTHDREHHLISIAVVPVIGGRRTRVGEEFYREMNPGVPIDSFSSSIHGFTDADVAGKRGFDFYARVILNRLDEPDAVFVCHNTIDAHVLRRELERLDERTEGGATPAVGLADLPNLPIIDTQRLASAVGYPGISRTARLSLNRLCDLTGVDRSKTAHHARSDARATADALIELLRHAAEKAVFWTFEDLLTASTGGTLNDPSGPSHIRPRKLPRLPLPADHVARHIDPLSDPVEAGSAEAERWLDLAAECATLRCPYLRDEAAVAAPANAAVLLRPLMDDLPHMTEPGQAGTLLGAVYELLTAPDTPGTRPVLKMAGTLKWWAAARAAIAASTPCERSGTDSSRLTCPACHDGEPCPRDVLFIPLAERVTLASRGVLDDDRVRDLLMPGVKRPLNTWRKHHGDVLAYALWRVARYLLAEGRDEQAYSAVDKGIAMKLHLREPRFAELACERLVENGDPDAALAAAQTVLADRNTDTAYNDLAEWVAFTRNALYAQTPTPRKPITHPRLARPQGHANPRLYT